ncbi:MAG: hypothetical protein GY906_22520 [bacterium]|nr:hypothetical protein [bacterium]
MTRRETVRERFKRTGYVTGPNHPLARESVSQQFQREHRPARKPKSGSVVMKTKQSEHNKEEAISKVLRGRFQKESKDGKEPASSPWPREIDDDTVIFSKDGVTYAAPYSLDDKGEATVGDHFPVGQQYVAL